MKVSKPNRVTRRPRRVTLSDGRTGYLSRADAIAERDRARYGKDVARDITGHMRRA
jgi:hypothetical protein